MPDIRLAGARVILRPPKAEDWAAWAEVRERNMEHLAPFEPLWPDDCLSENFFMRRLRRQTREWKDGRGYPFLIFKRRTGALIGGVNINNVVRGAAQFASLGYWLSEDAQGQGYMSESLTKIIDLSFNRLRLHRLNASCMPHNARSIALLERLGFVEEGFAKAYIQINGIWEDHLLFGLTGEDFKKTGQRR